MIWGYPPPWRWVFSRHGRGFSVPRALRSSCVALRGALCSGSLPGAGGSGEWCSAPNWWIQQGKWGVQLFSQRETLDLMFFFRFLWDLSCLPQKINCAAFAVHSQLNANAMLIHSEKWGKPDGLPGRLHDVHRCHQWIELSADGAAVFFGRGRLLGQGEVVRMGGLFWESS